MRWKWEGGKERGADASGRLGNTISGIICLFRTTCSRGPRRSVLTTCSKGQSIWSVLPLKIWGLRETEHRRPLVTQVKGC